MELIYRVFIDHKTMDVVVAYGLEGTERITEKVDILAEGNVHDAIKRALDRIDAGQ